MHDFSFKNGVLTCEKVSVPAIARQVGTPFYLYSYKTLIDHFTKIQKAFEPIDPLVCFAMKSNDNLSVIKALGDVGAGCDVVSGGELKKALKAGISPRKMVFASVGKTEEEIVAAIKAGILLFNVESTAELDEINRLAGKMNRRVGIALRLNPDVEAATHEAITTGTLKNKFGIDLASTRKLLKKQNHYPNLVMKGLHIHIGSQIVKSEPFVRAIKKVLGFIQRLRAEGIHIEYFDIGGGMGIIYKNERPQTAHAFARAVMADLKRSGLKIIMEPGRFISGNAGIFVTKVLYFKDNGFKKFLIVDGGMNDLIRPSLYQAYHEIVPVVRSRSPKVKVDIVGPICESGDFFGKDRRLPRMQRGDLLAVMSAGAYGYVMASNYNVRCRAPEVMVKGNRFCIVKQRETFRDLIRNEPIADFLKK